MRVVLSFFAGLPAGLRPNFSVPVETSRHALEDGADLPVAEPARDMVERIGGTLCELFGFFPYLEFVA